MVDTGNPVCQSYSMGNDANLILMPFCIIIIIIIWANSLLFFKCSDVQLCRVRILYHFLNTVEECMCLCICMYVCVRICVCVRMNFVQFSWYCQLVFMNIYEERNVFKPT